MRLSRWIAVVLLALWGPLLATPALAQVPRTFVYTGDLSTGEGPVDGEVDLTFEIYDAAADGAAVYSESFTGVMVIEGSFSVELGADGDLPTLFDGTQYWLQITVGDEVMAPRSLITSLPYAFRAEAALNADQLEGRSFDDVVEALAVPGTAGDVPYVPGEGGLAADNVQGALDEILGRVSGLETRLTEAEATIEAQATTIAELTTRLEAAETGAQGQGEALTALTTRVDAVEGVNTAQGETLTEQAATLSAHTDAIAANTERSTTNATSIGGLNDRAAAIEVVNSGQDEAINSNATGLSNQGARIGVLETAQGNMAQAIDALTQSQGAQDQLLTNLGNEIAANTQTSTSNFIAINGDGVTMGLEQRLSNANDLIAAIDGYISAELLPLAVATSFNIQNGDLVDVYFEGVNLHVRNGDAGNGTYGANGRGNLVLGYNAVGGQYGDQRGGSHNVVVGDAHNYAGSGSIVAGIQNSSENNATSILGGTGNRAVGEASVVVSGYSNATGGLASAVISGYNNVALGEASVVVAGGFNATQSGEFQPVDNNGDNVADTVISLVNGVEAPGGNGGALSVVGAGEGNVTNGFMSAVLAGTTNQPGGRGNAIVAGRSNAVTGTNAAIVAGQSNATSGNNSVIVGGFANRAAGLSAGVLGGLSNRATGDYSTISGGGNHDANGIGASISGGVQNDAIGDYSSVSGGRGISVSTDDAWAAPAPTPDP